jgi:hypothetical protein
MNNPIQKKKQIPGSYNKSVFSLPSYFETAAHSFRAHSVTKNEDIRWQMYFSKNAPGDQVSVLVRKIDNFLIMSDSVVERETNELIVQEATGDVLMIGLGINLVNDRVLESPLVTSVTVVEKYADIIEHVPTKCFVLNGDANTLKLGQYDTIWVDPSEYVTRNFRLHLKPGGRVMYWDASAEKNGLDRTHLYCPGVSPLH